MAAKRVVIFGAGRIAWLLEQDPLRYKPCTHAGALLFLQQKNPQSLRFFAVVDPVLRRAQDLANWLNKNSPQKEKILVFSELPQNFYPEIDLAVIACSTKAHYPLLSQCLRAKIPKIVVEKPVVLNQREVDFLKKGLNQSPKTQIWPNYERRFHPKYQKLKKDLEKEKFGKILNYEALFFSPQKELFPNKNYEGILLHDTTHLLDLVQFLFGEINKSQALLFCEKHVLFLKHKTKISGEILTLPKSPVFHLELEILTEKKRIFIGNGFLWEQDIQKSPHYSGFYSFSEIQSILEKRITLRENPFLRLYKDVLNSKVENNNHFFQDALKNVAILCQKPQKII